MIKIGDEFSIEVTRTALVLERQISEGVLVANKAFGWFKRKKKEGTLQKLDFQSAFDIIRWDFLNHLMIIMGSVAKWEG